MKKFIALILCLSLISCTRTTYADEIQNDKAIMKQLNEYLIVTDYDIQSELKLSDYYIIEGAKDSNAKLYFVFDGDECIGKLETTTLENQLYSSFVLYKYKLISEAFKKEYNIELKVNNDRILCLINNVLYDLNTGMSLNTLDYNINNDEENISLSAIAFMEVLLEMDTDNCMYRL